MGGFSGVAICSLFCLTGTGDGDQQDFGTCYWRCCSKRAQGQQARLAPQPAVASQARRVIPTSRTRVPERTRTTHILHEAGSPQKPRAAPQGPVRCPGGGAGPESLGVGARQGRPLLIGQRRSRAVRPGIGNAPSQRRSNGTGGCGLQSWSPRGWGRSRAQSPRWEPGRGARTMPYLLISTQTRMVSTTARLVGVRAGPGPQGLWPHLGASLPGSPPDAEPKNRLRQAPSGHGEGGW